MGIVLQWQDRSGNFRHLSGGISPTYSNGAVIFDINNNERLAGSAFMYANGEIEVFAVVSAIIGTRNFLRERGVGINYQSTYLLPTSTAGSGDRDELGVFMRENNNNIIMNQNSDIGSGLAVDNTYKIWNWIDTGSNISGRVNCVNDGTSINYTRPSGTIILNNFELGRKLDASVKEILITNVLTTPQRQKVEAYLAYKHGLVDSLPSDHPYKSN